MYEIIYENYEEQNELNMKIKSVLDECYKEEKLANDIWYLNITLSTNEYIKEINKEYRNIDKETDVLSFPMYEKDEIEKLKNISENNEMQQEMILGDIIISIPKVEMQAQEYGHTIEREFSYMLVHGFYHLMGYDHMHEEEKEEMRKKEDVILERLNITK